MTIKSFVQRVLNRAGYQLNRYPFHSPTYLQHTARRLEHLASLNIPVHGKSVLEVGAGAGDLSHYYIDRGCRTTITDARESNLSYLRSRYPSADIRLLDLENPVELLDMLFDIVQCYGVLYHLRTPDRALAFMAKYCRKMLFLESKVSFGNGIDLKLIQEDSQIRSLSFSGSGCCPTRAWIYRELRKHFDWVYLPCTQPNHPEFPIDWTQPERHRGASRAIFIASRQRINNELLTTELIDRQTRHP